MATDARPKDTRPYITLTNEYPRHRKIRGLSDAAFRLHVTLLTMANEDRTDGKVLPVDLDSKGPKVKKELLDANLVDDLGKDGFQLHDYLKHQNSSDEIEERIQDKRKRASTGGKISAHNRHHVDKGVVKDDCELCQNM
jgi:hypothetical protein